MFEPRPRCATANARRPTHEHAGRHPQVQANLAAAAGVCTIAGSRSGNSQPLAAARRQNARARTSNDSTQRRATPAADLGVELACRHGCEAARDHRAQEATPDVDQAHGHAQAAAQSESRCVVRGAAVAREAHRESSTPSKQASKQSRVCERTIVIVADTRSVCYLLQQKRLKVIEELIDTERNFVTDMVLVLNVRHCPVVCSRTCC